MQTSFPSPQLQQQLTADIPLVAGIRWHDAVDSTNAVALRAAADGAPHGTVVGAEVQTAGRGRRGRDWFAPAGTSLTLSVLLRPTLPREGWSVLPLMVGLALHDVATACCPAAQCGLKWPNDLLIDGVKAAGVLLEGSEGAMVAGVGLNVDWRGVDRPDELIATSLAEHAGADLDRGEVLRGLLRALDARYAAAVRDPSDVVQDYTRRCVTLGRRVTAHGAQAVTGTATSITPQGHLRIDTDHGEGVTVTAGDVEHLR